MPKTGQQSRQDLTQAKRVVIKFGSNILLDDHKKFSIEQLNNLVEQIAKVKAMGKEVVLVTSGSVAAGLAHIGKTQRPRDIPTLQMAAALGQTQLISHYHAAFSAHNLTIAQVLLTHSDLNHRVRHLNARHTLMALLSAGIVPIVNENDAVSVDEIRLGDNDVLSALVSILVGADALLLMTTPEGLLENPKVTSPIRIPYLSVLDESIVKKAQGKTDALSTGGMTTKIEAAQLAGRIGAQVVIASGKSPENIHRVMLGEDVGTLIDQREGRTLRGSARKCWVAYFHRAEGDVIIDSGAVKALVSKGKSLLPSGITAVKGNFSPGDLVRVVDVSGQLIARGLVDYSSADISKIKGHHTRKIIELLGREDYPAVIHRDNLALE